MSISSKTGIGNTLEIVSNNTTQIKSESVADVVSYLTTQGITVNSITNHKGVAVNTTSTALIGTGYTLNTNSGDYSVIVYGDANGDGEVDAGDMKVIIDDFLGTKLTTGVSKIAVDVYQDGALDAADLKIILDSFLGNLKGSILNGNNSSTPTPVGSGTPIMMGGQTVTLTKDSAPLYYGKEVLNYNSPTSATWRLFYIDFDGKYGDAGTVYLKADQVGSHIYLNQSNENVLASSLDVMKRMNPEWLVNDGIADDEAEQKILWLCDESKWSGYKNTEKAQLVMGTPCLEMWVDSYNQYHSKKGTDGYEKINYKWCNLNLAGYSFSLGNSTDYATYVGGRSGLTKDFYNMYIKADQSWWFASPCYSYDDPYLCGVSSSSYYQMNSLGGFPYMEMSALCPVVALKSNCVPDLDSTPEPTPTPTPTPTPMPSGVPVVLTRDNAVDYYGKVVTNYNSPTSATWRLFYIDFDGKYGDAGTVYLKADPAIETRLNKDISSNSVDAINRMKQMNPDWASNSNFKVELNNEKAVTWLCDETKWENYKDANIANYVIGAPSLEMYLDSYNQYNSKKGTSGYQQIRCKWNYVITASGSIRKGYFCAVGTNDYDYYGVKNSLKEDQNNMYAKQQQNNGWWLASPNYLFDNEVASIYNEFLDIGGRNYRSEYIWACPLASIKSGITLEFVDN